MKTIEIDDLTFEVLQLMAIARDKYFNDKNTIADIIGSMTDCEIGDPIFGDNDRITKAFRRAVKKIKV
jgi:hypothetical protein